MPATNGQEAAASELAEVSDNPYLAPTDAEKLPDTDKVVPTAPDASRVTRGVVLGMISAVGYSSANLALRGLSGRHDDLGWSIWVTAMKAFPTVVLSIVLLSLRYCRSESLFPVKRAFPGLLAAALLMQFGGNLGFQIALGHIGLAITVPLVFAFIICAGAVLGKWYLGDVVSPRTALSMLIMTVSIILLSYAATLNHQSPAAADNSDVAGKIIWFGILMAVVSGTSYGINGVVIRGIARNTLPIESMLIVYSSTGLLSLGVIGYTMMGPERLQTIRPEEWAMMLCAGIFNAIAFFCITNALKLMNISHVNVLNASQNAMCAVAAVLIFAEPVSAPMIGGIGLSILGLLVLGKR